MSSLRRDEETSIQKVEALVLFAFRASESLTGLLECLLSPVEVYTKAVMLRVESLRCCERTVMFLYHPASNFRRYFLTNRKDRDYQK